ncbi:MAG: DUF4097 domain-containing protein [Clostridia bacterium]|nr:DUF4097 domain-containing protein [Clostridia bacterium]
MKGFVKVIIAGAVILGIGIIMLIALLAVNGWELNPDWEMKYYECEAENTELEINYSAGEISTLFYDGDKIKIEYPECKNYDTTVYENGGKFSIVSGKRHWYNVALWTSKIPAATVYIPKDAVLKLDVTLNAGVLKIASGKYADIKFTMNAGAAQFGETVCGNLRIEMNAGALNTGNIIAETITAKVNAGAADFKETICGKVGIELNAGSVNMQIDGISSEYSVSVEKNAGACNLSSRQGTTDKRVDIEVNAGSCTVNFTN